MMPKISCCRRRVPCPASVLLLFFLVLAGSARQSQAVPMTGELRCQCIQMVSGVIQLKRIASIDLIPEGPHCAVPEVIATLKNMKKVCLDTTAAWVQLVVKRMLKAK